jgi:hypothetical protein
MTDPRTVDEHGFVIGSEITIEPRWTFGGRRGVGGLSSVVSNGEKVGVIVALDTVPETGGLLLHLVWLDGVAPSPNVDLDVREAAMSDYQYGRVEAGKGSSSWTHRIRRLTTPETSYRLAASWIESSQRDDGNEEAPD